MARTCRLSHAGRLLWITNKGKVSVYIVDKVENPLNLSFRLVKADGEACTVSMTEHGPACCCADATYRSRRCKHILSLISAGLMKERL